MNPKHLKSKGRTCNKKIQELVTGKSKRVWPRIDVGAFTLTYRGRFSEILKLNPESIYFDGAKFALPEHGLEVFLVTSYGGHTHLADGLKGVFPI